MGEQDGSQVPALQRPPTIDPDGWPAYWNAQGQPWRTEPEIDTRRQKELAQRRTIVPDIKKGIYPFKGMKLHRADVEWLLTKHESGGISGSVECGDGQEREREGLDLRGVDLRQADLHSLPLTRLRGGLILDEWWKATQEQRAMVAMLMEGANLSQAQLEGADLSGAQLENANLSGAQLKEANLSGARLGSANLSQAQLEGAYLSQARLEKADLIGAKLGGANLSGAHLEGACFIGAQLGNKQRMGPRLADVHWGNANLSVVEWSQFTQLGDEWEAHQKRERDGKKKTEETRFDDYRAALRANRQLVVVLRNQGLNDEADHFAYRAQLLQRVIWRYQRKWLKCIFSWFLYLLAGYGYRPLRSILSYLFVIASFAVGYYEVTHFLHAQPYPLAWYEALILSISSFHGRGFFQPVQSLGDPVAVLASIEAIFGLLIEISFIATFTQRFFSR